MGPQWPLLPDPVGPSEQEGRVLSPEACAEERLCLRLSVVLHAWTSVSPAPADGFPALQGSRKHRAHLGVRSVRRLTLWQLIKHCVLR